ncbi:MAG: RICIN domain-containing protein [Oscillospiraceae bacterium]|nr:RICIN domain-containing protein [Oscillospiraceae bacterium]
MKKRIGAALLSGVMCMSLCSGVLPGKYDTAATVSAASGPTMEHLDRGITAVNTGSGMLVSWRFLANDPDSAVFKLYRNDTLIYTSNAGDATCYLDAGGSASSTYRVETYNGESRIGNDVCSMNSNGSYFDVPLKKPGSVYTPNDCSVGDVDGDGEYELFVKWDPSTSKDNSQKGKTDPCIIECYKLDGTRLWQINIGHNIRSGAHYTQFFVADFDLDGKAEMTCKTADGTVDGQGNVIGDASAVYYDGSGLIYSGPEYYTLFDGESGKALHTIDYEPGRGDPTKWGKSSDKYNRVERYWGVVAYLDGLTPSVVTGRGYYGRMTATAYKVENDKLVKLWAFDTGTSSSTLGYGDGNHNSMPADVDGDGRQEIITGSTCIDDDGTLKWCTNQGHGDAMHVGDLDPANPGIEVWICHEDSPYGVTLIDGDTGQKIFHKDGSGDTGRCCADNVWAGNDGAEFWGNGNDVYNSSGSTLSCRRPAINFLSYWDGDLEREILDGYTDSPATITKMKADGTLTTLLSTDGYYTCNTTKGTPCLSADLFGDWREELVVRAADGNSVRIYTTSYDTDYRITTLMHDAQYRNQVASQQVAYNQPPHPSFYLGSERALPARPNVNICIGGKAGAVIDTTHTYRIKNQNSGLYLEAADAVAANGTNVQQGTTGAMNWTLEDAGEGYYRVYSEMGDGKTYLLDLDYGNPDNGTNIGVWGDTQSDAQLFKFVQNGDGSYTICTKATGDKSALGVTAASKDEGANVIQWECDSTSNQNWILEIVIPVLNGKLFTNLQVQDTSTYQMWSIDDAAAVGDLIYGDRTATYLELPDALVGAEVILPACDAKFTTTDLASFTAGADMTVYVALDSRVTTAPAWLSDWTLTDMTTCYNTDFNYKIYAKEMTAGEVQTLGTNGQSSGCVNYTVFAVENAPQQTDAPETTTEPITTVPATTTAETTTTASEQTDPNQGSGAETTTAPVQSETTTTTQDDVTGTVLYGDVNLDNGVSIVDVVMLNKSILGSETLNAQQKLNADVNRDLNCDANDSLVILKHLVDLIETLPV